jgi:hypothetical protein
MTDREQIVHEGIDLCGAQFALMEHGILVRGGLTIGEMYWQNDLVFGPGLVRAYELEKDLARFPRIVIDAEILQELRRSPRILYPTSWGNYFREDFDGMWFVDYLNFYVAFSHPKIIFHREGYRKPYEGIRRFLIEQLEIETAMTDRRAKYRWLANYFNTVIQHSPPDSGVNWTELIIPLE